MGLCGGVVISTCSVYVLSGSGKLIYNTVFLEQ